jgi:phosphatidylglycerophosphate synthase
MAEAQEPFGGASKVGESVLGAAEKRFIQWMVPRIPAVIAGWHLTLCTVLWSGLAIVFGLFARHDLRWLWFVSLTIALQWLTDSLDGSLGRARGAGLVKWGFFMDHFLDYLFLASLVIVGHLIAPPNTAIWYLVLLTIAAGYMVNSFLSFGATNRFEIYHFGLGPTELRIVFVIINTVLIYSGTEHLVYTMPLICALSGFGLVVMVWRSQRRLWRIDMENKRLHDAS